MGLGHKRRNLLIAQTLVDSGLPVDVLLISGMQDASRCPAIAGVDYLTLPALHKDTDGQYQARRLDLSLQEIISLRSQLLRTALASFKPDVFIVDNVPRGAVKELDLSLKYLHKHTQTRCILGLRDILDEPAVVQRDWNRAANEDAIRRYYHEVWVYGDRAVYDAAQEYQFSSDIVAKFRYLGYLDQRSRLKFVDKESVQAVVDLQLPQEQLAVCFVGGGQDGANLATAFAQATLPPEASGVIVTGPFMPLSVRQELQAYANQSDRLKVLDYLPEPTLLLAQADWVVSMGGYNTTCEILSFEKRSLVVPRVKPRQEQIIRAERLQQMNIVDLLHPDQIHPAALTGWMAQSKSAPRVRDRLDLNGLTRIAERIEKVLTTPAYCSRYAS
ncbi:glycosyltransferase [Microcoleus sp. FACHB-1515]|uniref:glycosyltransferase family protein n=1 Tax=Cyanophyceae TaxID=3028117 RepID=UPI00168664CD|nr:glycosyltransferase [Microcoleus sp. FACHB-1515]MBD2091513.1 glycosyltransferase [Microcoleus sp. FACHB-1515]